MMALPRVVYWDRDKNIATAPRGAVAIFLFCVLIYSPGAIAPAGQTSAQVPQSKQVSGSIL